MSWRDAHGSKRAKREKLRKSYFHCLASRVSSLARATPTRALYSTAAVHLACSRRSDSGGATRKDARIAKNGGEEKKARGSVDNSEQPG